MFKFYLKNVEQDRKRRHGFGGQNGDGQRVEFSLQSVRHQQPVQRNAAHKLKHSRGTKVEGSAQRGLTCRLDKENWFYSCMTEELKQMFVEMKDDFPVRKHAGLISADAPSLLTTSSRSKASDPPF